MTAAGYIRLSDQDQSTYSIPAQERAIREYCERYKLTLTDIFTDNGESSYTFDRKNFKILEASIKRKKVSVIVVYHLDRFSRNMAEAITKIKLLLDSGIKVRDITEPLEMDDHSITTFTLRTMKFFTAETELRRIRERTKMGVKQAYEQGRYINRAPYGYINQKDDKGKPVLVIDPEKAQCVKIIFNEILKGSGIEQARKAAIRFGYNQGGNSAVRRILENSAYAGFIRSDGKAYDLAHKPIISKSAYFTVQSILNKRKTKDTEESEHAYLKGMVYCECGTLYTSSNPRGKMGKTYWYYVCPQCKKNIPLEKMHDQFNQILQVVTFSKKAMDAYRIKVAAAIKEYMSIHIGAKEKTEAELRRITEKIHTAESKFLTTDNISTESFNRTIATLREEEYNLKQTIDLYSITEEQYETRLNETLSALTDLKKAFSEMGVRERKSATNMLFPGVLYYTGGVYRTPIASEIIGPKAHILKEKRLLEIQEPSLNFGGTPTRSPYGSIIELLLPYNNVPVRPKFKKGQTA